MNHLFSTNPISDLVVWVLILHSGWAAIILSSRAASGGQKVKTILWLLASFGLGSLILTLLEKYHGLEYM
jgi:hypothetical protein